MNASNATRTRRRIVSRASSHPDWQGKYERALQLAVNEYDLTSSEEWQKLDALSQRTEFDGSDVFPESAIFDGEAFQAPGNVYVTLNYNEEGEPVTMSEAFPATIYFSLKGSKGSKTIEIDRIEVNTASFYA